jgi:peptide/nickel transport system substrate-binding protein
VKLIHFKKDWSLNPDVPTLGPWRTTRPISTPTWVLERNPYYYVVDTAGNQLPYIDRIVMTLSQDTEILNLRAIAGEYDLQERHIDLGKLPVIIEKEGQLYPPVDTAIAARIRRCRSTPATAPIRRQMARSADFRRALLRSTTTS